MKYDNMLIYIIFNFNHCYLFKRLKRHQFFKSSPHIKSDYYQSIEIVWQMSIVVDSRHYQMESFFHLSEAFLSFENWHLLSNDWFYSIHSLKLILSINVSFISLYFVGFIFSLECVLCLLAVQLLPVIRSVNHFVSVSFFFIASFKIGVNSSNLLYVL